MSKKNSRTTNSIYNFITSVGGQFIAILMQFVVRSVFINTLGKSYLGISGLFSNILSMLALAEFGVGNAILYKLYDPLAKEDHQRIAVLMKFYKKVYMLIGLAVACMGIVLIPFLPSMINDYDKLLALNIKPVLVFLLYLLNSVSSYLFFAYKSAIVKADQKEYVLNIVSYAFTIGTGVGEIILLVVFSNFELYVAVKIVSVIVQNIICARIADRKYPFINDKTEDKLELREIRNIIKDCGALFLYRLNIVVQKATDNLMISFFLGIEMVGMYSNYYMFYTTVDKLMGKVFNSVAHSLGNLHTGDNLEHQYKIYEAVFLVTAILGGTAGVGIAVVANDFVKAWVGEEWTFSAIFAVLLGVEVFTLAFRQALSKYRSSMGLFRQAMYRPLAGIVINLIVSWFLVQRWGICGVLAGTVIAEWSTMVWYDPLVIHKCGFKNEFSVFRYYRKFAKYVITAVIITLIDIKICSLLTVSNPWVKVITEAVICGVTVPTIMFLTACRTTEGQYIYKLGINYVNKIVKKAKRGR